MAAVEYLLDAGPLVAFFDASDRDHAWSRRTLGALRPPLITCEAVLSEALFLLRSDPLAPAKIGTLFDRGLIACRPLMDSETSSVLGMMQAYRDVPMSFADACLIRLSEMSNRASVITLDSDFMIYRRHRNQPVPTVMPRRRA